MMVKISGAFLKISSAFVKVLAVISEQFLTHVKLWWLLSIMNSMQFVWMWYHDTYLILASSQSTCQLEIQNTCIEGWAERSNLKLNRKKIVKLFSSCQTEIPSPAVDGFDGLQHMIATPYLSHSIVHDYELTFKNSSIDECNSYLPCIVQELFLVF